MAVHSVLSWKEVNSYPLNTQGTHKSLKNNQNAKATVTAIIDGTGSMGAAIGPLVIGWVTNEWVGCLCRLVVAQIRLDCILIRLMYIVCAK